MCGVHAGAHSAVWAVGAIAKIAVAQYATLSCPKLVLFVVVLEILVGVPVSMRSAIVVALLLRALTRHGRGGVLREKTLLNACNFTAVAMRHSSKTQAAATASAVGTYTCPSVRRRC